MIVESDKISHFRDWHAFCWKIIEKEEKKRQKTCKIRKFFVTLHPLFANSLKR